ncbi:hypothetical protein CRG98_036035 [Punica granatum]|uniref:Uncharacterized protein n=1 Tax=Punica granatum TaxID=22663 RepID=A0A2I0IJR0_PUNGR|nr:hypothetical protein CRG98_036035 [Punica granatum]
MVCSPSEDVEVVHSPPRVACRGDSRNDTPRYVDSAFFEPEVGGRDAQVNVEAEKEFSPEDRNLAFTPITASPECGVRDIGEFPAGSDLRRGMEDEEDKAISECVLQRVEVVSGLVGVSFVGFEEKVKKLFREIEMSKLEDRRMRTDEKSVDRTTTSRKDRKQKRLTYSINYERGLNDGVSSTPGSSRGSIVFYQWKLISLHGISGVLTIPTRRKL